MKRAGELQVAADLKRALRIRTIESAGDVPKAGSRWIISAQFAI